MILQLLIENALKHGIGKLKQGGDVIISSKLNGDNWTVTVENSGTLTLPNKENSNQASGVGINNIQQRLSLVYGEQSSFTLKPSELGVIAIIKLPA